MKKHALIERFGGLTKAEPISTINTELLGVNNQVYENRAPFFNYYDDIPGFRVGSHIYMELDGYHPFEMILRATAEAKSKAGFEFHTALGGIVVKNHSSQVIRVINLANYNEISELQEIYGRKGVKFRKKHVDINKEMVEIKLEKFFHLKRMKDGLYFDETQCNLGYFKIPHHLSWKDFKELTRQVKFETSLLFFDAASAYFYENRQIVNLVRIFKNENSPEKMLSIKERYLKILERF